MWQYNNVRFIFSNPVASVHGQEVIIPFLLTYMKSKYALIEALQIWIDSSYLGPYTEFDHKSVKFDKPFKV
jgi:hypothetical protein